MAGTTLRDIMIGVTGALLGRVALSLVTSVYEKTANLEASKQASKQVVESYSLLVNDLMKDIVALRLEAEKAREGVNATTVQFMRISNEIADIEANMIELNDSINSIEVFAAIEEKLSEYETLARQIVYEESQEQISSAISDLVTLTSWEPINPIILMNQQGQSL